MNDDQLLDEDSKRVDFNETPPPAGIEQAIGQPLIVEHSVGSSTIPPFKQQEEKSQQQEGQRVKSKRYEIDGIGITVNYETLMPTDESVRKRQIASKLRDIEGKPYRLAIPEANQSEAIFYLNGWSSDAGDESARRAGQAFADTGGTRVFVIDTKPDRIVPNSLSIESRAVAKFVSETFLDKQDTEDTENSAIIVGYSKGGDMAIDTVTSLQGTLGVNVRGLVLLEPVGLYDQGSKKRFVGNFVKDTFVDTPGPLAKRLLHGDIKPLARGLRAGTDVLFSMIREIRRINKDYPDRISSEISDMINTNTNLDEIGVPVVIVEGINDPVSDPNKTLPGYRELDDKTLGYGKSGPNGQLSNRLSHALYNPLRDLALRETLFPKSPHVSLVTGRKLSNHAMPLVREEQVAITALSRIGRFERNQTPINP